jgi:hypothetical protein
MKMDAHKLLNEQGSLYGLNDTQREQMYKLLRDLENISQGINAPERVRTAKSGNLYNHPDDWFITNTMTVEKYISLIKTKAMQASM